MNADELAGYDAVVYDLDGTLVHLAVDWGAAARDAVALFERNGHDASDADLWSLLERADDVGLRGELEALLSDHECEGARTSERLPPADDLPLAVPTGVCSLNCEAACRLALDVHDLSGHVDAVLGRDSAATYKPDPESLLATLRELDVPPDRAVFVGDSERDELTAERAGVAFRWYRQRADRA
ncbi:HAD family hydrolase [Halorarum halophilum]|uniref:HAD family hydrolase n=1 Tax=Halorarum halophilum TaxID=2743090 RepID=A0A7D5KL79_9EURY|nr:HAD hydrolase-like protein [Halobaculum halophilum]QLG26622.1 HAD family hydrolase [Halobaculum halophilum]